jgi:predicted nucleotide-binding protein
MAGTKPTMFIGSSVEGKRVAEQIQESLEYEVESTVWHQGVFGLSGGTLETLVDALDDYDFATLVLTADDLIEKRDLTGRAPRDNVLFELGLFMGALGRRRTFIVAPATMSLAAFAGSKRGIFAASCG